VVGLTANFRSLDPIRDITNDVFKGIFPADDTKHQARFAPLDTMRGKSDAFMNGVFVNPISKVPRNSRTVIAETDAKIVANWIFHSVNGGLKLERKSPEETAGAKPGDFMIIAKGKSNLAIYAKALEAFGVPYELTGGEKFSSSEELYEIYKVLKAVADPKDPVAIVAAIRGSFFGASDNDLYEYARMGGKFSYLTCSDQGPQIITAALKRLRQYHEIAEHYSPVTAVEMIIEALGTVPLAMSEEMGSSRAGNILKAIELLRGEKPNSTCSFIELVDYLHDLRETAKIEEMSLSPATSKAVRIMNLHKAKGLEAPVVILVDPGPKSKNYDPKLHIARTGTTSVGYFTISRSNGEYASEQIALPHNWDVFQAEEKLYEDAEKVRLDYVAVTRAKNILIVSTYEEGVAQKPWERLYPYLKTMEQLPLPAMCPSKERKVFAFTKTEWKTEQQKIALSIEQMKVASYATNSVSAMAEKRDAFSGESKGKGADWGTVVHRALELCAKGKRRSLDATGLSLLEEGGLPASDLEGLLRSVDVAMKHEIWQRMEKAEEKYFEVPFSGMQKDTVVRGVIDMIFKGIDGWVLVDYKTDDFEKDLKRKVAYQSQLKIYAQFWEEITGETVKEMTLLKV